MTENTIFKFNIFNSTLRSIIRGRELIVASKSCTITGWPFISFAYSDSFKYAGFHWTKSETVESKISDLPNAGKTWLTYSRKYGFGPTRSIPFSRISGLANAIRASRSSKTAVFPLPGGP